MRLLHIYQMFLFIPQINQCENVRNSSQTPSWEFTLFPVLD